MMPDALASIIAGFPPLVTKPDPKPTPEGMTILDFALLAVSEPLTVDDYPFAC